MLSMLKFNSSLIWIQTVDTLIGFLKYFFEKKVDFEKMSTYDNKSMKNCKELETLAVSNSVAIVISLYKRLEQNV